MDNLPPFQEEAIKTWTQERDVLLQEISGLSSQKEALEIELVTAGLNLDDLRKTIELSNGRMKERVAFEERLRGSLNVDIAELQVQKTRLEGECFAKELESDQLTVKNGERILSIASLSSAYEIIHSQAKMVNNVVNQVIETSLTHLSNAKVVVDEIGAVSSQVIEKANENVKQTNIVLEKLPRYIFELQKPIPIRRVYAAERNHVIEPETI